MSVLLSEFILGKGYYKSLQGNYIGRGVHIAKKLFDYVTYVDNDDHLLSELTNPYVGVKLVWSNENCSNEEATQLSDFLHEIIRTSSGNLECLKDLSYMEYESRFAIFIKIWCHCGFVYDSKSITIMKFIPKSVDVHYDYNKIVLNGNTESIFTFDTGCIEEWEGHIAYIRDDILYYGMDFSDEMLIESRKFDLDPRNILLDPVHNPMRNVSSTSAFIFDVPFVKEENVTLDHNTMKELTDLAARYREMM